MIARKLAPEQSAGTAAIDMKCLPQLVGQRRTTPGRLTLSPSDPNGKIERYHRTLKEQVKLVVHETPSVLQKAVAAFVDYYNHRRYHEGIGNVTPADAYYGRREEIRERRKEISKRTPQQRRNYHRASRERESHRSVH
jgi:hypothetical protein